MLAMNKFRILGTTAIVIAASIVFTSCKDKRSTGWEYAPNMYEHTAYDPDQPNKNFKDGKTAQLPPAGTTPRGFRRFDFPGTTDGYHQADVSFHLDSLIAQTPAHLAEGKKLFTTFCSPCHGVTGQGDGLVVQHGYPAPPSYSKGQSSRGGAMKDLTDGKIYHTITYGVNSMGSYASQITPDDRLKIVMYVHQLQKL